MCGIAGIVGGLERVDPATLGAMLRSLEHRGPDGVGTWFEDDESVGLGSRRLAILDRSDRGSQPMMSGDGRYCMVYNGEVYNYKELREFHDRRGICYCGDSDTEVVLNHFILRGSAALEDFDGMFAFAVWDRANKELFCARDRFGEKPFYYSLRDGSRFIFASEIKALHAAGVNRSVDHRMLYSYFRNPSNACVAESPEATFYEGISKLPAATWLTLSERRIAARQRYWSVNLDARCSLPFDEAVSTYKKLFDQSISRRLRSDVEVGSSLSGGVDSSSIVCTIARLATSGEHRHNTFSARFHDFANDEGPFIDEINQCSGAIAHSVYPDASDLTAEISKFFYFQDEPVESSSAFAQWSVMKLAKETGVTVLLDGHGGDEIAAGYEVYLEPYLNELSSSNSEAAAEAQRAIRDRALPLPISSPAKSAPNVHSYAQRTSIRSKEAVRRWLAKSWLASRPTPENLFMSRAYMWEFGGNLVARTPAPPVTLAEALSRDLVGGKLEHYLRYADRNSMAHSREVRLPFLSHLLVEFALSLPASYMISGGWTKYITRKAMENVVPESVVWRPDKIGFATPSGWLHAPGIRELASEGRGLLSREGILNGRWKDTGAQNWELAMGYLLLSSRSVN
jgi:asparagine synthase (glutamine-hydrolysing)